MVLNFKNEMYNGRAKTSKNPIIDFDSDHLYTRFWSQVEVGEDNECWKWTGYVGGGGRSKTGLPRFMLKKNYSPINAYRVAYALYHQQQLDDISLIMHACDNPVCCNPHHLKEGTQKENMADCKAKGRIMNGTTKLTKDDVAAIRDLSKNGINNTQIAKLYPVGRTSISRIISGTRWAD